MTRAQVFWIINFFFFNFHLFFSGDEFNLVAEFAGYNLDDFGVEALVDRNEDSERHAGLDDVGRIDVHQGCQVGFKQGTAAKVPPRG